MRLRLDELPRYSSRTCLLSPSIYNRVRLGILRLESPLRFALPGLRTLEMVLEDDAWVCVDAGLSDYPILAWVEFQGADRSALHTPVPCRLFTYHAHAELIEPQVLEKTENVVNHRLRKWSEEKRARSG